MAKRSKLRVTGNARFFMMLARDIRRRWLMYGENRKLESGLCETCNKNEATDIDHITAVGKYPRCPEAIGPYVYKMLYTPCQRLCKSCHLLKTSIERRNKK